MIVLGDHPVSGYPLISVIVRQGRTVLAVGAGGDCLAISPLLSMAIDHHDFKPFVLSLSRSTCAFSRMRG